MDFVGRAQAELAHGLHSVSDVPRKGVEIYTYNYARSINNTLHSFQVLVESKEIESARILIRPALEIALRLEALVQRPELLVRIARWEHEENLRAANALKPTEKATTDAIFSQSWSDFLKEYRAAFPSHSIVETPMSAYDAASMTGILGVYDLYYRFYCKYSHGAISTLLGLWDDFSDQDANVAGHCLMVALGATKQLGGNLPGKDSLEQEYLSFAKIPNP